jgi:hypothetical protein
MSGAMTGLSPQRKADLLAQLEQAMAIVRQLPERRGCCNCDHMSNEGCNVHGAMPPEAYQQANDCPQWVEEIPF